MIIMITMMTTKERTDAMTAHLLARIASHPDRRDKLHAARAQAITDRNWKKMDDITRRIAKMEAK